MPFSVQGSFPEQRRVKTKLPDEVCDYFFASAKEKYKTKFVTKLLTLLMMFLLRAYNFDFWVFWLFNSVFNGKEIIKSDLRTKLDDFVSKRNGLSTYLDQDYEEDILDTINTEQGSPEFDVDESAIVRKSGVFIAVTGY